MSWRLVSFGIQLGSRAHMQSPFVKSRILAFCQSQRRRFHRHVSLLSGEGDVTVSSKYLGNQDEISAEQPFNPGLFNIDISSSPNDKRADSLDNVCASLSIDGQRLRKHSYINYGTHLDPNLFYQLSQGWMTEQDGGKCEVFHPKLTSRIFYNEAKEYEDTAVVYPRVGKKQRVAGEHSLQRNIDNMLDQFKFDSGIKEQDLPQILESLHECSDESLLGMADDERFNKMTKLLCECCPQFEMDTFVQALTLLARVQIRTGNQVLRIFEMECEKRFTDWNVTTSLLVCDSWRLIGLPVKSLNERIFRQIEQQLDHLTKCQVVQLMYLIGENRYCNISLLDNLQDLIHKYINTLSLTELGAVCQGFFKSKTNLKPVFISALASRIQSEHLDHVHSFYLVGILKVFRQAYFGHRDLFNHFGDAISPRLQTFPISSIMHILLTYATLHILNKPLLDAGTQVLINRSQECRCKDVTKFLWSFATLNHCPKNSESLFKLLIMRMVRLLKEYEDFPVFLVSSLLSLAYLNIYPAELLDVVFSPKFLLKIDEFVKRSGIDPRRDLFLLHCSVKIDCPEYQGNRLSKDFFLSRPLSPRMFGSLPYELSRRPILREVAASVASVLGGEQYIKLGFSVPHMKTADIEIHLDLNNIPMSFDSVDQIHSSSSPASLPSIGDKFISLDTSLIANLSGSKQKGPTIPTGNRTASSTSTRIRTASKDIHEVPKSSEHFSTVDCKTFNLSATPLTSGRSLDRKTVVDEISVNRTVSFALTHVGIKMSRFDVPEPLCKATLQGDRLIILVWSRNHFHFNGKTLLGLHSMKRRQLLKLGYKTVDIPFFEWDKLTGPQEQEDYIRRKIFSSNHNNRY